MGHRICVIHILLRREIIVIVHALAVVPLRGLEVGAKDRLALGHRSFIVLLSLRSSPGEASVLQAIRLQAADEDGVVDGHTVPSDLEAG